jgi:uncharacterized membrane protein YphA (DoxX/SURF4 family)
MREWFTSLLRAQVPLVLLVFLRVVVGYELFMEGNDKLRQGYFEKARADASEVGNPLEIKLKVWIEEERPASERAGETGRARRPHRMFGWYRFFLENAVLPHVWVFAVLVTAGEMVLGAMLMLGLLARVASFFGILLVANYLCATWHYGFPCLPFNILLIALLLVFIIAGVGRCLGLDSFLNERFPEIPLF